MYLRSVLPIKKTVFVGNVRQDRFNSNTFDLWIVGDQLLKGAALNAFQIATHSQTIMIPSVSIY